MNRITLNIALKLLYILLQKKLFILLQKENYLFCCGRCEDPSDLGSHFDALLCSCGGLVEPEHAGAAAAWRCATCGQLTNRQGDPGAKLNECRQKPNQNK